MAWDTGPPIWPYQTSWILLELINAPAYVLGLPLYVFFGARSIQEKWPLTFPATLLWWWFIGWRIDFGLLPKRNVRRRLWGGAPGLRFDCVQRRHPCLRLATKNSSTSFRESRERLPPRSASHVRKYFARELYPKTVTDDSPCVERRNSVKSLISLSKGCTGTGGTDNRPWKRNQFFATYANVNTEDLPDLRLRSGLLQAAQRNDGACALESHKRTRKGHAGRHSSSLLCRLRMIFLKIIWQKRNLRFPLELEKSKKLLPDQIRGEVHEKSKTERPHNVLPRRFLAFVVKPARERGKQSESDDR